MWQTALIGQLINFLRQLEAGKLVSVNWKRNLEGLDSLKIKSHSSKVSPQCELEDDS